MCVIIRIDDVLSGRGSGSFRGQGELITVPPPGGRRYGNIIRMYVYVYVCICICICICICMYMYMYVYVYMYRRGTTYGNINEASRPCYCQAE